MVTFSNSPEKNIFYCNPASSGKIWKRHKQNEKVRDEGKGGIMRMIKDYKKKKQK